MNGAITNSNGTEPQPVDLIIMGAGPAGLSTALHLLKLDASWAGRMVLLEKAAHPRPKLCGGGVTRLGLEILRDLGIELPLPIPQARVEDVRLKYERRLVHVRGRPQVVIFHRPEMDAFLAEEARRRGAAIQENESVHSFQVAEDGVLVKTDRGAYLAKAVVGADGSHGVTRMALNRLERRSRAARALEVLVPTRGDAPHFTEKYALFDFTPVQDHLQGYFWDFPSRVGGQPAFNRGIYDARLSLERPRAGLPKLLQKGLQDLGTGPGEVRLAGHPIHWFSPRSRLALPRLLLVGDAAGADPLFGEGIAPALGYGQVAAKALQHAFRTQDFSFRDYRRRVFRSRVGRYLLFRWAIAWGSYRLSGRRWFMNLMWTVGDWLARNNPQLEEIYEIDPPEGVYEKGTEADFIDQR